MKYVFYEMEKVGLLTPRMGFIFSYFANRCGVVLVHCYFNEKKYSVLDKVRKIKNKLQSHIFLVTTDTKSKRIKL